MPDVARLFAYVTGLLARVSAGRASQMEERVRTPLCTIACVRSISPDSQSLSLSHSLPLSLPVSRHDSFTFAML